MNTESSTFKVIVLFLTFLLGLLSTIIVDKIRLYFKNRRIKKFILLYLEKGVLEDLPTLINEYSLAKNYIMEYSQEEKKFHVYEGFNTNVLKSVTPADYYAIFKDNYILLNQITSMIEFMSSYLPLEIMKDYYDFINSHLKEKQLVGNIEHVKTCKACIEKKEKVISTIDNRIIETEKLINSIKELMKNCG